MVPTRNDLEGLDSRSWEARAREDPLVVLPVGALEAHGPHLPLGADLLQAESAAEALARRVGAVVVPGLPFGVCVNASRFPGTISVRPETLAAVVEEVLTGLARGGVRRLLVLSGHGEPAHMAALRLGAERAEAAAPSLRVVVVSEYDVVYELRGREAPPTDGHAGLLETSMLLHVAPERVGSARPAGRRPAPRHRVGPPSPSEWPESVDGDPREASAALGARVEAHVIDRLVEIVARDLPAGG